MPDPADLLGVARELAGASGDPSRTEAHLRRAVSTAYYALFHKILRAAAERFIGADQQDSAGYALIYRSFEHRRMKEVCEALDVPILREKLRASLGRSMVSQDTRDFANAFGDLQEYRHLADYHPSRPFGFSEVSSLIDRAAVAMEAFDRIAPQEQADILALLMVGARN